MASRLTPIGLLTKFVVVPVAIGALGFYVVGPRIGKLKPVAPTSPDSSEPSSPSKSERSPDKVTPSVKPTEENSGAQPDPREQDPQKAPNLGKDSDAPTPDTAPSEEDPKPRVRKGHRAAGSLVAPPTDPTPDDGGSAGGPATNDSPASSQSNSTSGKS